MKMKMKMKIMVLLFIYFCFELFIQEISEQRTTRNEIPILEDWGNENQNANTEWNNGIVILLCLFCLDYL